MNFQSKLNVQFKEGPEGVKWDLGFAHFQCWELGFSSIHVFITGNRIFLNATGNRKFFLKIGTGISKYFVNGNGIS